MTALVAKPVTVFTGDHFLLLRSISSKTPAQPGARQLQSPNSTRVPEHLGAVITFHNSTEVYELT